MQRLALKGFALLLTVPGCALALRALDPPQPPPPPPAVSCPDAVQGRIAWDYSGNTTWNPSNVERLCRGAGDDQPALCFDRVMHGGLDWGGATRWQWQNAIDLCEGTTNADATIACFQSHVGAGRSWQEAIRACGG